MVHIYWNSKFKYKKSTRKPCNAYVADYDMDGRLDILVTYEGTGEYRIFSYSDSELSEIKCGRLDGIEFQNVLIRQGDFDGDGCADFIVGVKEMDRTRRDYVMNLRIYLGDGTGGFQRYEDKCDLLESVDVPADLNNVVCMVYDYNHDGKDDAVFSFVNNKGGEFIKWYSTDDGKFSYDYLTTKYSMGYLDTNSSNVVIGDFNGDGYAELVSLKTHKYENSRYYTFLTGDDSLSYGEIEKANVNVNKIVKIRTDYGKVLHVNYMYASERGIGLSTTYNYPLKVLPGRLHVVNEVKQSIAKNDDVVDVMRYSYGNLLTHVTGKGLIGFDSTRAFDKVTGATTSQKVTRWNSKYFVPEATENITSIGDVKTVENSLYTYSSLSDTRFLVNKIESVATDYYGNKTTVTQTMDSRTGLLTGKETRGFDGSYTKEEYEYTAEKAGGIHRPQKVITRSKHFQDDNEFVTEVRYEYNEKGDVSKSTDAGRNVSTEFEYDASGNVVAETTVANDDQSIAPVGYRYEYDRSKRFVTCKTDINSGDATRYTYNSKNHLVAIADPLQTTFEYDALGRQIKSVAPDGVATSARYEWTDISRGEYKVTATQTGTPDVVTYYDAFGRAIKKETKGELGIDISTVNTYDEKGQLIQTVETEGDFEVTNSYDYDELGRIAGEYNDKTGKSVKYEYGKNTTAIIEDGKKTVKEFDSWGNVRSLTDPKGNTAQYTYASCGKPKSISFEGAVYRMDYDAVGRKTAYTTPNSCTRYYFYDAFDRLVSENYTNRKYDDYKYDELGRLLRKKGLTEECTYTYGDNQRTRYLPITEKGKNCEVNYEYDEFNRLVRQTKIMRQNKTFVRSYNYTPAGKLSTETLPSGDVMAYEYDNNGFTTNITLNGETVWSLSGYNGIDREVFISNPGGYALKRVTHRDSKSGAIKAIEMLRGSTKLHSFAYEFDQKTGNLMKRTGMQYRPEEFEYDKLDRLTRVSGGSELTMEYEDNGNIAYKSDAGEYTYKTKRPHAVTKVAAENMWNWIWPDIEYTGYNKPCRIHVDDLYAEDAGYLGDEAKMEFETIYSAEFDGNNDKCYCCLNLIDFFTDEGYGFEEHYYDGNYEEVTENRYDIKTYQMLSSKTRRLIYCYTPDGLTAIKVNSTQSGESALYRVETDHLGSLYALRGTDGNARYVCKYDAWGSRTLSTVPSFMRMGYCGHEHWDEFNLIDMGGRMYDPKIARFVSIDPHVQAPENIQNFNGYSYCLNNPLKYSDPSGEFWQIVVGALIGGLTNVLQNVDEISNFGEGMAAFGIGAASGIAGSYVGAAVQGATGLAGFVGGAVSGSVGGAASGFIGSAATSWISGGSLADGLKAGGIGAGIGVLSGGAIGGMAGGFYAQSQGGRFWDGVGMIYEQLADVDLKPENVVVGEGMEYSAEYAQEYADAVYGKLDYVDPIGIVNKAPKGYMLKNGCIINKEGNMCNGLAIYMERGKTQVCLGKSAFISNKQLIISIGHEYIHATHNYMAYSGNLGGNNINAWYDIDYCTEISAHNWEAHQGVNNGYKRYDSYLRGKGKIWRCVFPYKKLTHKSQQNV